MRMLCKMYSVGKVLDMQNAKYQHLTPITVLTYIELHRVQ